MMNTQCSSVASGSADRSLQTLRTGSTFALSPLGGELEVLHGRVWLTRARDLDDHVVEAGQRVEIAPLARAIVQGLDDDDPSLIAWRPARAVGRVGNAVGAAFCRCWDIVDPARRIGAGAIAAAVALASGALLFGPLSDARTRALIAPPVLHNSAATHRSVGLAGTQPQRSDDVIAASRLHARSAAQEARRRPAVPA
jgi:DUF2917 family protein